jgi:hypothetical protein
VGFAAGCGLARDDEGPNAAGMLVSGKAWRSAVAQPFLLFKRPLTFLDCLTPWAKIVPHENVPPDRNCFSSVSHICRNDLNDVAAGGRAGAFGDDEPADAQSKSAGSDSAHSGRGMEQESVDRKQHVERTTEA